MKCEICGKEFELHGFASHIKSAHKISSKDYYDRFMKKPNEGICVFCGKETPFYKLSSGYKKCCNRKYQFEYQKTDAYKKLVKTTNLAKYGTEWSQQSEGIKNKIVSTYIKNNGGMGWASDNVKETNKRNQLDKYAVDHISKRPDVKQKIRKTIKERYNVNSSFELQKTKESIKNKYGVEHPLQSTELLEKSKQTCKKHNGVEYGLQSANAINSMINKYGVEYGLQSSIIHNKGIQTKVNNKNLDDELENPDE